MSEEEVKREPAVIDGVVQYSSPSALERARKCLRSWWFRYVLRLPDPSGKAALYGIEVHKQMRHYLKTGDKSLLDGVAMKALEFAPWGGPDNLAIRSERELHVYIDGLRVVGLIDLTDYSGVYQTSTGDLVEEPDTVEVLDWKTKRDMRYALSALEMSDSIQMIVYGACVLSDELVTNHRAPDQIRLSHVYLPTTTAKARKVSRRVSAGWIEEAVTQRVVPLVRLVRGAAKMTRQEDVPADTTHCRNCAFSGSCTAQRTQMVQEFLPITKGPATDLFQLFEKPTKEMPMSIENEMQKLLAEEAGAKPVVADPFIEAIALIEASGHGFPALSGDVAKRYLTLKGQPAADMFAGEGVLSKLPHKITKVESLLELAQALKARAQAAGKPLVPAAPTPPPQPVAVEPPRAAAPSSLPETKVTAPTIVAQTDVAAQTVDLLAPEAANVQLVADATPLSEEDDDLGDEGGEAPAPSEAAPAKKPGRPKGSKNKKPGAEIVTVDPTAIENMPVARIITAAPTDVVRTDPAVEPRLAPPVTIYVRCLPTDAVPPSFDGYIHDLVTRLEKKMGCLDLRASDHAALAFGKWKGVLAQFALAEPPTRDMVVYATGDFVDPVLDALARPGKVRLVRGI